MKSKLILIFVLLFADALTVLSQPAICGTPAAMTSTCAEACIICDINGFTGNNNSTVQGQAPAGFCTTVVHHMQWIAFIAGTTDLTLSVDVFNCNTNAGLEIGLYHSNDCQNFTLVSNCNTDVLGNTTESFTNTVPLVIGEYYYLVMDGNQNDVCSYTIHVVNGSTQVAPLTTSGPISGQLSACPGTSATYQLSPPLGATLYQWTLDGAPIGANDTIVSVNWANTGNHQLCATASNVCNEAPESCVSVSVETIPPQLIQQTLCSGDCFTFDNQTLCDPGTYNFNYTTALGCDSLIQVQIGVLPSSVTNLDLYMCDGDTLHVGASAYTASGQYQDVLTAANGCDSTVNLALNVIICDIIGQITPKPISCNGGSDGTLSFSVANGTPPFTYNWELLGSTLNGNGVFNALNQTTVVGQLPVGNYFVTINDNFGDTTILIAAITEPFPMSNNWLASDYLGSNVSCAGGGDGWLQSIPAGGVPPYTYMWSNTMQTQQINGLSADNYMVTIQDSNNCFLEDQYTLTEPPPLVINASFIDANCDGEATGIVRMDSISGGVAPYQYDLSGDGYSDSTLYTNLHPGNYTLSAQDANGCITSASGNISAPLIPDISLGDDVTINLSDSTRLLINTNVPLNTITWSPVAGLSCYDCPNPFAGPYNDAYYDVLVSTISGCTDADTIHVHVEKIRDIYIPNCFSPNADGVNDLFTLFCGPSVLKIRHFEVYDRWGTELYSARDFLPNDQITGWNGYFHGKAMNSDVYVWLAEVEYLDGAILKFHGDINIIK